MPDRILRALSKTRSPLALQDLPVGACSCLLGVCHVRSARLHSLFPQVLVAIFIFDCQVFFAIRLVLPRSLSACK